MTIINEHYLISNVTSGQYKVKKYLFFSLQKIEWFLNEIFVLKTYYSESQASTSMQPTEPQTSNPTPTPEPLTQIQVVPNSLNDQHMLMVQQFSTESRLNFEWSKQ